MERRLLHWPRALAATLLFGTFGTLSSSAQQQPAAGNGSKFKVLVPTIERGADTRGNFGRDVAEELRKLIVRMPRHEPVERKEMQDALRRFGLKEDDMGCIQNMQLAVAIQAELVVCGRFSGASGNFRLDSIQVISAKTQESFRLSAITSATAKEAAAQIFTQFDRYIATLENAAFCYDYLASQDWARAIENCDRALAVNPSSVRASMGKGFALYSQAAASDPPDQTRLAESLALYKRALDVATVPEQEALRMAGIIAARLGQNEESRDYFRQYLELNPGDAQVRLTIANEQSKAGDKEGALRVVEEGLKTDSADIDLLTWAGVFAAQAAYQVHEANRGENNAVGPQARELFETAARYYQRMFDVTSGDVEPALPPQFVQTLILLERFPEAVEIGNRARQNPKTNTAQLLSMLASAHSGAGNTAEAVNTLDAAIAMNDTTVKGLRDSKARILLRSGDVNAAVAAFQSAVAAGETEGDQASTQIWGNAYTTKWAAKDYNGFLAEIELARQFAQSDLETSKLNYWAGTAHSMNGRAIEIKDLASARAALPHFENAIRLLQAGAAYASSQDVNLAATLNPLRQYADYLKQRIASGR